jgi:uncharacterized protein YqeY
MKAKQELELSVLRMLRTSLKNKQIDLMHELSEEEVLAVIRTQIKQVKDSIDSFESANRSDLAEKSKSELVFLERYLPAEMSDEDLEKTVREALTKAEISFKADMGKAMGTVMKAVAGKANGSRVKAAVERVLE